MRNLRGYVAAANHLAKVYLPALAIAATAFACSYKTPPAKTPTPTDSVVAKATFRTADNKAKNFVCGWAPLSEVGYISEMVLVHKAHTIPACNLQFQIEKEALVGKQVNPSVPPKDWATVITIPIGDHVNYVAVKDKYDRPTRDMEYNSTRDNWDARDLMKLNFAGLQIHDWAYEILWGGTSITSVSDIEITKHNGKDFIGFTLSVNSPIFGRYQQAQIRMNFLEFESESTATFQPRIYNDDNSNHLNAIWGLGAKVEGLNPISFVARWDMRPEALPHKLCLNGFEGNERARKITLDSIEEWNQVLARTGITPPGRKAFVVSDVKYKFDFDLRCSNITYVSDKRIAEYSPLGIAMAQADVNNGKILWGGMVIYGGALEWYIEAHRGAAALAQNPAGALLNERLGQKIVGGNPMAHINPAPILQKSMLDAQSYRSLGAAKELKDFAKFSAANLMKTMTQEMKKEGGFERVEQMLRTGNLQGMAKEMARLRGQREGTSRVDYEADAKKSWLSSKEIQFLDMRDVDYTINTALGLNEDLDRNVGRALGVCSEIIRNQQPILREALSEEGFKALLVGKTMAEADSIRNEAMFGDNWRAMGTGEREARLLSLRRNRFARMQQANLFDVDNRIADFVGELPADLLGRSVEDIVDVSLRKTILHEFGHMMGLAHNFKENIMPDEGTVPEKYYQALAKDRDKPYHQNTTTIMGYPHPYQIVAKRLEDVKLGAQDELTLRYIYLNQYATYRKGDADFTFRQVPGDGRIPSKDAELGDGYRVSYFKSCTDYQEWFSVDPYCNRWDRGYDAKTIVQGYLDDYENNHIKKLENLADSGVSEGLSTYYLWTRSLDTFSRVRKFYDYMRYTYRKPIADLAKNDPEAFFQFEKCNGPEQTHEGIKKMFASAAKVKIGGSEEFANLCEANLNAFTRMASALNDGGPDFSRFNNEQVSGPVGEIGNDGFQSMARFNGTWTSLGVLPMKISALYAITTAIPFNNWGGYIYRYARPELNTKYIYASVYPRVFTKSISNAVLSNLKFVADGSGSPQMGRTSLFMGSFLYDMFRSMEGTNDYHIFGSNYIDTIASQTNFNLDWNAPIVPVLINAVKDKSPNADPERVKMFTGLVYIWGEKTVPLGAVYMLPKGKVFLRATQDMFVLPMSEAFFISDDMALVWGLRVEYTTDRYSNLGADGVKAKLHNKYVKLVDSCMKGAKLESYFSIGNPKFKGFKIIPGIAGNTDIHYGEFTNSTQEEFKKYWADPEFGNNDPAIKNVCERATEDLGLVVTQALSLINVWMPQIVPYTVH